jgi:elongation factor P--beta-lysine ligase
MEAEAPALSAHCAGDPNLDSIRRTCRRAQFGRPVYLQTFPASAMKRLRVAVRFVKFVRPSATNGETGRFHNPECATPVSRRPGLSALMTMTEVMALSPRALNSLPGSVLLMASCSSVTCISIPVRRQSRCAQLCRRSWIAPSGQPAEDVGTWHAFPLTHVIELRLDSGGWRPVVCPRAVQRLRGPLIVAEDRGVHAGRCACFFL